MLMPPAMVPSVGVDGGVGSELTVKPPTEAAKPSAGGGGGGEDPFQLAPMAVVNRIRLLVFHRIFIKAHEHT